MLQRLFAAASNAETKELFVVAEGTHNDTFQKAGEEYPRRLIRFIQAVLARKLGPEEALTRRASPRAAAEAAARADQPLGVQTVSQLQPEPLDVGLSEQ
jgi:hypothetical protein